MRIPQPPPDSHDGDKTESRPRPQPVTQAPNGAEYGKG